MFKARKDKNELFVFTLGNKKIIDDFDLILSSMLL